MVKVKPAIDIEKLALEMNEKGASFEAIERVLYRRKLLRQKGQLEHLRPLMSPPYKAKQSEVLFYFYDVGLTEEEIAFLVSDTRTRNDRNWIIALCGIHDILHDSCKAVIAYYFKRLMPLKCDGSLEVAELLENYRQWCADNNQNELPEKCFRAFFDLSRIATHLERHAWR